jgi:spermidine synthase
MKMRWYFLLFIGSGFCSLVYEVIWLRLAMAAFGVTTAMVSLVLSMFMAGLGLGCWGAGSLMRRLERRSAATPLRLYGLCELLIGAAAIVVPYELSWGHSLLPTVAKGVAWQSSMYYLISGAWVALTLLPWCGCMGATFPFAMGAIQKSLQGESERSFSYLYIANVVGAVLGTLVPAFLMIELFGFRTTLYLTSALNLILASCAFLVSIHPSLSVTSIKIAPRTIVRNKLYNVPAKTILWLLFATGLISMGMEVVWIRQFTPYLGNVVYAFAVIVAIYLIATSVGSHLYRRWVRSHTPSETGYAWMLLGLFGLFPLFFAGPKVPIPKLSHEAGFVLGTIRVCLGVAPFSALLGFLTPMLVDHWSKGNPDQAGNAYATNVVGSILGPLLAGFCLLPYLDNRWALVALAVPLFVLGAFTMRQPSPTVPTQWRITAVARALAVVLGSIGLIAASNETKFANRVVRRDYAASVVATGTGLHKNLFVNGIGMTILTPITKMMAHLPLAALNRPPQNGLVICFGMGTTFRSMLSWKIDTTAVDLVPSVPEMFGYYHPDGPELLKSPLAHVVIDDGRRFLEGSATQYDVITLDPPPPVGAPTSSLLYSREFYEIVKSHLRPDGILQVWLPGGDAGTRASVAKALKERFPYVRVFGSTENWGLHFIASMHPLAFARGADLAARLSPASAADLVEWGPAATAEEQFNLLLAKERSLDSLIGEDARIPAIQDNQPINEYFFLRWNLGYYR